MKFIKTYRILLLFFTGFLINGCVEPYEFETDTFESALVVEGTVTNELRHQEVQLTRTFRFEEEGPQAESNAQVKVVDDFQNEYVYQETSPGIYVSQEEFRAEEGQNYQLLITTTDGGEYASQPTQLAHSAPIQAVVPTLVTNQNGEEGVGLVLEGAETSGEASYYRYEFEETFKIVSPYEKSDDLIVNEFGQLEIVRKLKEEYTCYRTEESEHLVIANTGSLSEDKVNGLLINIVEKGSPKMSHRYSILVKQFGISRDAYRFYETLKNLSESESLFSQIQPGYLNGNLYAVDNPDEKVLGYFSVSEVTTKRTFFSFEDFYGEDDERRPFVSYCPILPVNSRAELINLVQNNLVRLFQILPMGGFTVVRRECVDCTVWGSNEVPEFWVE